MSDSSPLQHMLAVQRQAEGKFDAYMQDPSHDILGADHLDFLELLRGMQTVHVATGLALKNRNHFARDLLQSIK